MYCVLDSPTKSALDPEATMELATLREQLNVMYNFGLSNKTAC